jgi:HD-GYP domain-containing protein (c-di-GMP phosphodiesterase class II)
VAESGGGAGSRGESGSPGEGRGALRTTAHAQLAGALKNHARMREMNADIVLLGGAVVEVRRGEAAALVVPTEALPDDVLAAHLERLVAGRSGLLLVGDLPRGTLAGLPAGIVAQAIDSPTASDILVSNVEAVLERVELRQRAQRRDLSVARAEFELGELVETARAITQERDIDRLLDLILRKSRFLSGADAGSIYVVDRDEPDSAVKKLNFKLSQNDSVSFESGTFSVPVTRTSIAGSAVLERRPINIPNVYALGADSPYRFDPSFDKASGYRSRSVITVPMISAEDEVIGVIQLLNKKKESGAPLDIATDAAVDAGVIAFESRDEEMLLTLASQAGIALENAILYAEIKRIFEGFVRASVQAIEARDPTTSGHSLRVSLLTTRLADVVDRVDAGVYADVSFTRRQMQELEYAAMLHDFGKIGVREEVLVKAKKLYPSQLQAVRARVEYALSSLEKDALERKVKLLMEGAPAADVKVLDEQLAAERETFLRAWHIIEQANEPTVMKEGDFSILTSIGARTYVDAYGATSTLLSPEEIASLQVRKGTLNHEEMREIQSHVAHTFQFLSRIPWGKHMRRIPEIAGSHHEKLNGAGYPRALTAEQIPLESKIMSIADIYDALTARDRPYKKALPLERALSILEFEVKDGHIDGELVRIFREAKVYEALSGDLEY